MGSKICMNGLCGATTSPEWKRGWTLKSGGYSTLCYNCGTAYENVVYCERFHLNESGWRECKYCEKPIHCGCIVSKYLHDYLDLGGIACVLCSRTMENRSIRPVQSPSDDIRNGFGSLTPLNSWQSTAVGSRISGVSPDKGKPVHLTEAVEKHQPVPSTPSHKIDPTLSFGHVKREGKVLPAREVGTSFSSTEVRAPFPPVTQKSIPPSIFVKPDNSSPALGLNDMYDSIVQASLNFSLGGPQVTSNSVLPNPGGAIESSDTDKVPPFKQGQRTRHILPKPPKPGPNVQSQANRGTPSQIRVARPPGEGRGRNQLLPRYWPRITDQELEQISGDLNSNIVPLFEKILSASDAGRIGRLVLPKACAEAYFPPISNSEGLPIRIQDIKGKEWTFQFRFWPNNNSRMYVLEGVTPCVQNMQLQAGDTVTFSRIDPGGKLVIGCRKATTPIDMQEGETSDLPNDRSGEASHKGVTEVPPTKKEDYEGINGDSTQGHVRVTEKKRSRNIGLKSKRLQMHREDAMELRVTWEEAQELFRPPPSAKPNIVMVENYEFEEYDEPPVFGKRTIFTARASGEQEQWGQCDNCSKWRKLPLDILLPPRWTCSDNSWDPNRCSCSAADELNTRELERLLRVSKDFKRRRITEKRIAEAEEPTGLDALAFAAVLGDSAGDLDEPSLGATTRHPRHRPGCTCIVCIQPPSGKGKHKPTCICNVCLTVKRRFKTLMLRKKKRLLERESEISRGKDGCIPVPPKEKLEAGGSAASTMIPMTHQLENERDWNGMEMEVGESSKGQQLDLNCDPNREEELMLAEAERMSLTSLVNATLPLERYLGHNGLPSMVPCLLSRAASETDEYPPDDNGCFSPVDELDHESKAHEG